MVSIITYLFDSPWVFFVFSPKDGHPPRWRNVNIFKVSRSSFSPFGFFIWRFICVCWLQHNLKFSQILMTMYVTLGMLSATKNRKLCAHWYCQVLLFSLSPLANLSLLMSVSSANSSLEDGSTEVTSAFWEAIREPSKWLPEPPTLLLFPPQQIFVYFISLARTVSILPFPTPAHMVENLPLCACLLPYQGYSNYRLSISVSTTDEA